MSNTNGMDSRLRGAAIFLALLATAEAGVFFWQRARMDALADRLADIRTIDALELDSHLGLLVLLNEESARLSFDDLRATQRAGAAWLEEYMARNQITGEQADLLRGLLARYLADYAGHVVALTVMAEDSETMPGHIQETRRFFRAVQHILGEEQGNAFQEEIAVAWVGWVP